jgi:GTP cyclohydrolase III
MKERDFIINDITKKKLTIVKMFEIMVLLAEAKTVIIRQLEKIDSINTFVNTPNGYKVTNAEGFVAISEDGKTVKLVDRLTFSYMNFERRKT